MFTKKDILSITQRIRHHSRGRKNRHLFNPRRDWFLGLSIALMLLVGGVWFNIVQFNYYNHIEQHLAPETIEVPSYKQQILTKILERYDARARQFDEIRSGIAPSVTETVIVGDDTEILTEVDEEVTVQDDVFGQTSSTSPDIVEEEIIEEAPTAPAFLVE